MPRRSPGGRGWSTCSRSPSPWRGCSPPSGGTREPTTCRGPRNFVGRGRVHPRGVRNRDPEQTRGPAWTSTPGAALAEAAGAFSVTNPPMHAVACFVTPAADKRQELLQTLRSLAHEIRGEPGCVVCSVCLEETSTQFIVVSGWQTDADLRRHLRSEQFRVLSGASRLLGASAEVGFLASGIVFAPPTSPRRNRAADALGAEADDGPRHRMNPFEDPERRDPFPVEEELHGPLLEWLARDARDHIALFTAIAPVDVAPEVLDRLQGDPPGPAGRRRGRPPA